jgi:SAM-dependent methyltransferase
MNFVHRRLCRSAQWKQAVEKYIVPWVLEDLTIGSDVLEIGPGPGLTTDLLCTRAASLICVEVDGKLANSLGKRMVGRNVRVIQGDATAMSLPDGAFDNVFSFTMLHHVPCAALQDRLFSEAARVLRPGGTFAGTDSLKGRFTRLLHLFDTLVPVDPHTLPNRLRKAGFEDIQVDVNQYAFRFRARAPR